MACMTQSINSHFGCGITVGGFVLSNGLMSFDTAKGNPNSIAPGKLSLSSMTPTILLKPDGTAMMVSGSPGGAQIIAAMVNMVSNIVDHNMNLADAVMRLASMRTTRARRIWKAVSRRKPSTL